MKRLVNVFIAALVAIVAFSCVKIEASAAKSNKTKIELKVGQSTKIKVKGAKKAKWSSSKKSVVTVDKKGKITAKMPGTATIKAKTKAKTYKFKVTVKSNESDTKPADSAQNNDSSQNDTGDTSRDKAEDKSEDQAKDKAEDKSDDDKSEEEHIHNYVVISKKAATTTDEGVITYQCKGCLATYTESVPKLTSPEPHVHNYVKIRKVEPTTTSEGSITYQCSLCKDEYTEMVPKLIAPEPHNHKYVENSYRAPNCNSDGYSVKKCSCGDEIKTILPATGHDLKQVKEKNATCSSSGYIEYECTNCGYTERTTISATGHDDEIISRTEATCEESEKVTYRCKKCNYTHTETIRPSIGHAYEITNSVKPTCETAGTKTFTCKRCGKSYTEEIPALGHHYDWTITKEADYLHEGEESYKCSNCGDIKETRSISRLQHSDIDQEYQVELEDGSYETVIGHYVDDGPSEVVRKVNEFRASIGANNIDELVELTGQNYVNEAKRRALEISAWYAHTKPTNHSERSINYFSGENIACGYEYIPDDNGINSLVEAWKGCLDHKKNIIHSGYHATNVACFARISETGNYTYFWVQDFR